MAGCSIDGLLASAPIAVPMIKLIQEAERSASSGIGILLAGLLKKSIQEEIYSDCDQDRAVLISES